MQRKIPFSNSVSLPGDEFLSGLFSALFTLSIFSNVDVRTHPNTIVDELTNDLHRRCISCTMVLNTCLELLLHLKRFQDQTFSGPRCCWYNFVMFVYLFKLHFFVEIHSAGHHPSSSSSSQQSMFLISLRARFRL